MSTTTDGKSYRAVTHADLLNLHSIMSADRKILEPMTNRERAAWATDQLKLEISDSTVATVAAHLGLPEVTKRRTNADKAIDHAARKALYRLAAVVDAAMAAAGEELTELERRNTQRKLRDEITAICSYLEGDTE